MDKEKLLDISCKLGRGLLENGGEIYRAPMVLTIRRCSLFRLQ